MCKGKNQSVAEYALRDIRKPLGVATARLPAKLAEALPSPEDFERVLRAELGIENGLADERVYVLDPCCGTGAYLVEVLRRIKRTIDESGGDALAASDLKRAARARVFGFEILPAPFVVAHLQLGLLLQSFGVPLLEASKSKDKKPERAAVFLTNALTGWEPLEGVKKQLPLPGFEPLEEERDAAEKVKRHKPILVVLGNPPYNAFAGTSAKEEGGIVDVYKEGLIKDWGIKKFNLDDLYVRFFRLAERRIAEKTGEGIVCFISNFSYLSDPSFVVMRERFLREFDSLWFDSLNGDSRETGKLTPEGKSDPSVFSTPYNREGIRVGTAIGLLTRKHERDEKATVRSRELWGATKREGLLQSLDVADFDAQYDVATPTRENRFSFRPSDVAAHYLEWAKLTELCEMQPLQGMDEDRANALIDFDLELLSSRMRMYFDKAIEWNEFAALQTGLSRTSAAFDPQKVRKKAQEEESFEKSKLRPYLFRPSDTRWCYYSAVPNVWKRSRPELQKQTWEGNAFVLTRAAGVSEPEGVPFLYSTILFARDSMKGHAVAIPLRLRASSAKGKNAHQNALFADPQPTTANLSSQARAYLASLGITDPDSDFDSAALIWHHALAIGYSPAYLEENSDGIRSDFPRIPLPASRELLEQSAALGRQIAALLDTETHVPGVTAGAISPALRQIAVIRRADGAGGLDPESGDLDIRAGWGHRGKGGVVMPGKGRIITRDYKPDEQAASTLGAQTHDVYLNDAACWSNVPERVWQYTIGGYQVIKKWLSYREKEILGRGLTAEEAREVTQTARRIAAILLMETKLDENYEQVKADCYEWKSPAGSAGVPPA